MAVRFEKPTYEHIRFIADNMRPEDIAEVWAWSRSTPYDALSQGVDLSSYSTTVVIDDIPVAIMGLHISGMLTKTGVPWLLAATQAMGYRRQFLELSPPVISEMMRICDKLENYVHADNRVSVRWLKWLGFTIEPAEPVGRGGEGFHRFHRERGH